MVLKGGRGISTLFMFATREWTCARWKRVTITEVLFLEMVSCLGIGDKE